MNRRLERLSWPEIRERLDVGRRTVVVAFGATEQHGQHNAQSVTVPRHRRTRDRSPTSNDRRRSKGHATRNGDIPGDRATRRGIVTVNDNELIYAMALAQRCLGTRCELFDRLSAFSQAAGISLENMMYRLRHRLARASGRCADQAGHVPKDYAASSSDIRPPGSRAQWFALSPAGSIPSEALLKSHNESSERCRSGIVHLNRLPALVLPGAPESPTQREVPRSRAA